MANRAMKDSGVEWIGQIPRHWSETKLKRVVFDIDSGGTPTSSNSKFYNDKGTPFVNISDMTKGEFIHDTQKHLTENGILNKRLNIHPEGTILYSMYASLGKVAELKTSAAISQAILAFKADSEIIKKEFLKFILKMYEVHISMYSNGTTQSNLNKEIIENFKILLPELGEQQKIAAFLDEKVSHIDNIIEDTKKSIENLKAYKQSLITETCTKGLNPDVEMKDSGIDWIGKIPKHWISSRIKYVTNISRGQFSHRPRSDERYYDGQYPFIQTGDVARAKKYITTYSQTLNELGKSVSKEFPKGTLVMNIAANVGDVAILDFDSYFPDSVVGFVPKEKYHWNYLYYTFTGMKSMFVRTAISNTQLNLNVDRIKDMHVPVTTDYNEQLKISEFLDKKVSNIDSLLEKKGEVVKELESYKKALIYEYVTGKKEVK
ncbi:restriction endonuclease subunit S [Aerococcus urinaeequi]|uniref:restriction endonuclease subunit S n=1 Tax=Aerococcus urinaeequi TaxID=51665 RepID=UPI003AAF579B